LATLSQINEGFYNSLKLFPESWVSTKTYVLGEVIRPTTYNTHTYLVTTTGTTSSTEPTWGSTEGTTQNDGSIVYKICDSKTYQVLAPQSASLPYCVFGCLDQLPINEFGSFDAIDDCNYWVNVFSNKSPADVNELADEVLQSLDDISVSVSGGIVMKSQHTYIGNIIYDDTVKSFQIPIRFKLWVD
jgi:hypothetical protein